MNNRPGAVERRTDMWKENDFALEKYLLRFLKVFEGMAYDTSNERQSIVRWQTCADNLSTFSGRTVTKFDVAQKVKFHIFFKTFHKKFFLN